MNQLGPTLFCFGLLTPYKCKRKIISMEEYLTNTVCEVNPSSISVPIAKKNKNKEANAVCTDLLQPQTDIPS